MSKNTTSK